MVSEKNREHALNNIIIALVVCSEYITAVLGCYFPGKSGFFSVVMLAAVALFAIGFVVHPIRRMAKRFLAMLTLIFIAFGATYALRSRQSNLLTIDFIGMCLIPFFFGGLLEFDYKRVLQLIMSMTLPALPVYNQLFAKANVGLAYDAVSMGVSYALLPVVGASVAHFILYRREASAFVKLLYVVNFAFLLSFIQMSYRGALVSLIVVTFACFVWKQSKTALRPGIISAITVALVLFCLALMNLESLLIYLNRFLSARNIRIAFIEKNAFLTSSGEGGVTHGRIDIWLQALHGFVQSPVYGHGMSTFLYYTGYIFPHNFILQFLYDGGLLLAVPMLRHIASGLRNSWVERNAQPDKFAFVLLVAGIALPRALVSADVWRIMLFWLMMGVFSKNSGEKTHGEKVEH